MSTGEFIFVVIALIATLTIIFVPNGYHIVLGLFGIWLVLAIWNTRRQSVAQSNDKAQNRLKAERSKIAAKLRAIGQQKSLQQLKESLNENPEIRQAEIEERFPFLDEIKISKSIEQAFKKFLNSGEFEKARALLDYHHIDENGLLDIFILLDEFEEHRTTPPMPAW